MCLSCSCQYRAVPSEFLQVGCSVLSRACVLSDLAALARAPITSLTEIDSHYYVNDDTLALLRSAAPSLQSVILRVAINPVTFDAVVAALVRSLHGISRWSAPSFLPSPRPPPGPRRSPTVPR